MDIAYQKLAVPVIVGDVSGERLRRNKENTMQDRHMDGDPIGDARR